MAQSPGRPSSSLPLEPKALSLIQPPLPSPFHLHSPVQYRINPSAPTASSSLYRFAISTFSGLSNPGLLNSCCTAPNVLLIVYAGLQCSLVNSVKQISPVCMLTFGWQIGVLKNTFGGSVGYRSVTVTSRSHRPPAYAVPEGPLMTASQ